MIATASIPLSGMHFTGFAGFLYRNKNEYRFATYLGASVKRMGENELLICQGRYRLHVKFQKPGGNILHAPDKGKMIRKFREDVACQGEYTLTYGKRTFPGSCQRIPLNFPNSFFIFPLWLIVP